MEPRKILQNLLSLADSPPPVTLSADDVIQWPETLRHAIQSAGILRAEALATRLNCDQCEDGEVAEVYCLTRNQKQRAYLNCPRCGRVEVPPERLKQFGIDGDHLATWVAKALNTRTHPSTLAHGRLWDLGKCSLRANRLPVALVRGLHWQDAAQVFVPRVTKPNGLLLAISPARVAPSWLPKQTALISLVEIMGLERNRLMLDKDELAEVARNSLRFQPARPETPTTYPLPDHCEFAQIQMELVADDSVRIRVPGKKPREFDYKQLGLADRRGGTKPAQRLWGTLELFAVHNGLIDWKLLSAPIEHQERLVKHVQRLKKILQAFFETDAEPFYPYNTEAKSYRCRFAITDARYGGGLRT